MTKSIIPCGILTGIPGWAIMYFFTFSYCAVSDRCFAKEAKDESGPNLKRILSEEAK